MILDHKDRSDTKYLSTIWIPTYNPLRELVGTPLGKIKFATGIFPVLARIITYKLPSLSPGSLTAVFKTDDWRWKLFSVPLYGFLFEGMTTE